MITLPSLRIPYARVDNATPDPGKQDPPHAEPLPPNSSASRREFRAWLDTVWPLVLHFVCSIGISVVLIYYVDDNHFNIRDRRPLVTFANGTTIRTSRFSPLQSDISTILSAALVVLRLIIAAWAGPLCWRTLFFLMEKTGLRRRDLEWLIGYGFFPPSTHLRNAFIILVTAILTCILCAQSASPILTGSITWTPSSVSSGVQSDIDAFINVSVATNYSKPWQDYFLSNVQNKIAVKAAGFANQAWGRDIERGVLKRVLPMATRLSINSTITNVTLPYFLVTSLEWISDPQAYNLTRSTMYHAGLSMQVMLYFEQTPGMLAMSENILRDPFPGVDRWPFPPPSTVSETRIVMLNTGVFMEDEEKNPQCEQLIGKISHSFPQNTGFVYSSENCFAFARVTYTAGASLCNNCRLSSPSTVQNDSELLLEPHPMTTEALWMMPNVTANLLLMNTSIPLPWDDVDSYVIEVLSRSYSGTWTALNEVMVNSSSVPEMSHVHPTLPSLQAQLDLWRVYAWLTLQLLVTVTGIFFLWLQSKSRYALIGDTTMVAFDLDTNDAPKNDGCDQPEAKSLLKIEPKDDGWKVVVEAQFPPKDPELSP